MSAVSSLLLEDDRDVEQLRVGESVVFGAKRRLIVRAERYRDKAIYRLADDGYLTWALSPKGMVDMDPDLRWTLQAEQKRRHGRAA